MDSLVSVKGQLHPQTYVSLGSNLHVHKGRQNSDILVFSPEYPVKKELIPDIDTGKELHSLCHFISFATAVMNVVSVPCKACFSLSTSPRSL